MGRNMFDEGEANWPEEAPFGAPVFVLTHDAREPWERKGGTTFYFVTDGIESALTQAKSAAKGRGRAHLGRGRDDSTVSRRRTHR